MNTFPQSHLGRQHLFLTGMVLAAMLLYAMLPFSATPISPILESASWQIPQVNLLPAEARAPISAVIGADLSGYHARPTIAGLSLLNDAQALKLSLSKGRAVLSAGGLVWDMRLRAWGYGDALATLPVATPTAWANRVEYHHAGLVEWYVNSPLGLEQGFTLLSAPAGDQSQLALELNLPQGAEASLISQTGLALGGLTYSGLAAWDANGKALPAWMELSADSLRLRVDVTGASYPVTVDPWVQQAKLTASDGVAGDEFGTSVAMDGDTVVVGAHLADPGALGDAGVAYVFVKPPLGWATTSTFTAKLTASDGAAGDQFGTSAAVSGDVVVVGSPFADPGALTDAGAAYVFVKPGGGWGTMTETAKLTASDKVADDQLGTSVAIDGDVVVAGAPHADNVDPPKKEDNGAAYVYVKPVGGWVTNTQNAKLTPPNPGHGGGHAGEAVAISGDTVVVGGPGFGPDLGLALIYIKPAGGWTGTMAEEGELKAAVRNTGDDFGKAVAIDGDTVVVGARRTDVISGTTTLADAGAAYVFVKPGGAWPNSLTENAKLTTSDRFDNDRLGYSVDISGSTVVAGSPSNAAYLYEMPGGGWSGTLTETVKLVAAGEAGNAVAISGNKVLVGADEDTSSQGAAYVFVTNAPPVITESDPVGVTMSEDGSPTAFSLTLNATDVDGDTLTWSISSPASHGTASASGTGTSKAIGYTPTANYNGSDSFVVKVVDGNGGEDTITVNVTIDPVNDPPSFTSTALTSATEDILYTYNITATDPDNVVLTITVPTKPGWLALSGNGDGTATLSGTPTNSDVGPHDVTLRVSDGDLSAEQSFTITVSNVNDPPSFTSTALTSATEDILYTYNITATDPDNVVLTITVPTKPGWLALSDNGDGTATLSGTPTNSNVGPNSVTLRVSDGDLFAEQSFTITVSNVNDPPVITEGASVGVTMSEDGSPTPFSLTLNATDIDAGDTLTWSISSPASHGTASASGTGTSKAIGYTPNPDYNGSDSFVVKVSDGNGGEDTITVNVTINPDNEMIYLPIISK